ncbi:hypothetical protein [Paenibacillus sp. MSJ-34]|uniref:hypothetical protein n=1 Tax=Paenibacillus sp. MSJ-34 TaxID=2841529 RepID=UPI001C121746|nr:hypothetical protein [Paenibacillus sp. MSJ-34]MBU5441206.1 hypothetical protein [Paenibacillus sp. MSJ-34]
MADNELYRLDIVIGTDGIEQSEKQLRALDKMLEQTERRSKVFGKSRISPEVRLNDKASSKAKAIGSTLGNLAKKPFSLVITAKDLASGTIKKVLGLLSSPLALLGAGGGIAGITTVGLNMVMQEQGITSAFKVLLGSAEAAKQRVDELTAFAGQTPYRRDEIYEASRVLQVFTGNALSTGDGLKMVGDIAAGTQQQFGDVALWIGRLYDALSANRPVGEMTSRLQEMGAINGAARDRIEKLADSGMKISKTWPQVTKELSRFDGMMGEMSGNLQNLLLGTKTFFTQNIFKRWGMGLENVLGPALKKFKQWRSDNKETIAILGQSVEDFGKKIGNFVVGGIEKVTKAFNRLAQDPAFQNADFLGKLKIAWDEIIAKPFGEWWANGGEEKINSTASKIGSAIGSTLGGLIMGALGVVSDDESFNESPFLKAGATAGKAFLDSFLEAFDAGKIANKALEAIKDVNMRAVDEPNTGNILSAVVTDIGALWLLKKILDPLKIFKKGDKVPNPSVPTGGTPSPTASPGGPNGSKGTPTDGKLPPRSDTHGKAKGLGKVNANIFSRIGLASLPIAIPAFSYFYSDHLQNQRLERQREFTERFKDDPYMLEIGSKPLYKSTMGNGHSNVSSKIELPEVYISEQQMSNLQNYLGNVGKESVNQINVNFPPGAVRVEINEKVDENELTNRIIGPLTGSLADQLRREMNNRK